MLRLHSPRQGPVHLPPCKSVTRDASGIAMAGLDTGRERDKTMPLYGHHRRNAPTQAQQHCPAFVLRTESSAVGGAGDACVADPGAFGELSAADAPATLPSASSGPAPASMAAAGEASPLGDPASLSPPPWTRGGASFPGECGAAGEAIEDSAA